MGTYCFADKDKFFKEVKSEFGVGDKVLKKYLIRQKNMI